MGRTWSYIVMMGVMHGCRCNRIRRVTPALAQMGSKPVETQIFRIAQDHASLFLSPAVMNHDAFPGTALLGLGAGPRHSTYLQGR